MNTTTYTPAEFAATFPRARGHELAVSYVAIHHHPKKFVSEAEAPVGFKAVKVGHTNISSTKTVTRFAIIPAAE